MVVSDPVTEAATNLNNTMKATKVALDAGHWADQIQKWETDAKNFQQHMDQLKGMQMVDPNKWASLKSEFATIVKSPAYFAQSADMQKKLQAQFQSIYPSYKPTEDYVANSKAIQTSTQGAAANAIAAYDKEATAITGEKASLDHITDYNPATEAGQISLLITLNRQNIEQLQKLRLDLAAQRSDMGQFYGLKSKADFDAITDHQTKCTTATVGLLYARVHTVHPNITEAQVQQWVDAHPNPDACPVH